MAVAQEQNLAKNQTARAVAIANKLTRAATLALISVACIKVVTIMNVVLAASTRIRAMAYVWAPVERGIATPDNAFAQAEAIGTVATVFAQNPHPAGVGLVAGIQLLASAMARETVGILYARATTIPPAASASKPSTSRR